MAGSIALSLTQQFDKTSHEPLDGGLLYFYAAGTTTPQNAYQDISLTIPWPNPMTLDSGGNVEQLFFADGYIKYRLTNAGGVTQRAADFVLVMGPTSGVGAAPSVDATTILATGDLKVRYGTGSLTGFVRANGRTIGSATSSASERANSDCQNLFEYLWGEDENLTVSTGRGVSANADWVANKNIALPDWRGRALAALDDMGNSAAGRLTSSYFGTSAIVLGAAGGSESCTLTQAHLPDVTLETTITDPGHAHSIDVGSSGGGSTQVTQGVNGVSATVTGPVNSAETGITAETDLGGSGTAHAVASPMMLATVYLKL